MNMQHFHFNNNTGSVQNIERGFVNPVGCHRFPDGPVRISAECLRYILNQEGSTVFLPYDGSDQGRLGFLRSGVHFILKILYELTRSKGDLTRLSVICCSSLSLRRGVRASSSGVEQVTSDSFKRLFLVKYVKRA